MKAKYKYLSRNGKNHAEHRLIMEKHLNRKLRDNEDIHHVNGDGFDNGVENLQVIIHGQHSRFHALQRGKKINCVCFVCNKHFVIPQHEYRYRIKRSKSGNLFCSNKCAFSILPKRLLDIDDLIISEINGGLTGYAIAKKHKFDRKTVYNHIKRINLMSNKSVS